MIGLGAPVSVLIRPSACEAPLLRARLEAEIIDHERTHPPASDPAQSEWDAQRDAWHAMRAGLDASGESTPRAGADPAGRAVVGCR